MIADRSLPTGRSVITCSIHPQHWQLYRTAANRNWRFNQVKDGTYAAPGFRLRGFHERGAETPELI